MSTQNNLIILIGSAKQHEAQITIWEFNFGQNVWDESVVLFGIYLGTWGNLWKHGGEKKNLSPPFVTIFSLG
jgi:hypothetical protein